MNIFPLKAPYDFSKPHIYRRQIVATGRYYIGKHSGAITYKGSGKDYKRDYKKYVINRNTDLKEEILEYVNNVKFLNKREKYYLKLVDAANNPLYYNLTNSSGGPSPGKHQSKDHVLKRMKGHCRPVIQMDLQGNFIKEWISLKEARNALNIKTCLSSVIKKSGRANGYRWKYKDDKTFTFKYKKSNKNEVIQMDLQGNFIKEWDSATQVKKEIGINNSVIGRCCKGFAKTAGGFKWKVKEQ